jgi:IclR family KDG regulon transcriptional repressor
VSRLEKGLQVLRQLCEPPFLYSLGDLAKALGMTKSGMYKILAVLVQEGAVSMEEESGLYRIGPSAYRMGVVYANGRGLNEAALPVMEKIGQLTRETVSVGVRDGDSAFLALSVESPHVIRLKSRLGTRMPPNAGAIGKLLWAYHPDPARRLRVLGSMNLELEGAGCPKPILSLEELLREYDRIRAQGYALSVDESVPGFLGISVPVPDRIGRVWACLCVAGPLDRLPIDRALGLLPALRSGAEDIGARLG